MIAKRIRFVNRLGRRFGGERTGEIDPTDAVGRLGKGPGARNKKRGGSGDPPRE